MIIKIQRPLCSSGNPEALIYDEPRNFMVHLVYDEGIAKLFKKGEAKVYHEAHLDALHRLHIGERVQDQDW